MEQVQKSVRNLKIIRCLSTTISKIRPTRQSTDWHDAPSTAVVKRVDKCERKGSSDSTGQDVLSELLVLRGVLGGFEHGLDSVLESEVQGLCGEVPDDVGHVTWEIKNKTDEIELKL